MVLQYCSDLHLEFKKNKQSLDKYPLQPTAEILMLAGDIVPFSEMDKRKDFFNYISDNFKLTYWLPGNHEYYYSDAAQRSESFSEKIRDNIFLVNNTSFQHGDVRLIFSTLWSKISPANEWQISRSKSDFQVIKFNGLVFSTANFNQFHSDCLSFIECELSQNYTGKTVVVTHHVPTFLNFPSQYKGSILNEAFEWYRQVRQQELGHRKMLYGDSLNSFPTGSDFDPKVFPIRHFFQPVQRQLKK